MQAISKILCPVDFSAPSDLGLNYATDFAAQVGAEILLLHAFDTPASYDKKGQTTPADPTIASKLESSKSPHENLRITRMLHAGDAGQVICWAAQENAIDLIIMGTHGRTGFRHLLFGSTAEYVLQHARCPVLTIRQQEQKLAPLPEPTITPLPAPPYM